MCFSPQASFTAAATLLVLSALALKQASTKALKIVALSPLLFGIQQALEGIVWITLLSGDTSSFLHRFSVLGFLFFASIFWPVWVPAVFCYAEKNTLRKHILFGLSMLGSIFALSSIYQLLMHSAQAQIAYRHISYSFHVPTFFGLSSDVVMIIGLGIYACATIVPFFVSSIARIWLVGLAVAIGFVAAWTSFYSSFGSVWCFFAAIASILVNYSIYLERKKHSENQR